jgi:6-phosphogluconate dehydrogenase
MCPGSDDETLDMVLPLLEKVAAKGSNGKPCVGRAGTGGAGHYVKIIHNGIEHGMMSAIAEAWGNVVSTYQSGCPLMLSRFHAQRSWYGQR